MAANITQASAVKAGKLKRTDFKSWQEFAEALAAILIISFDAADKGLKGDKGERGDTPEREVHTINIGSGSTSVDVGFDCEEMIVRLVNNTDAAPTIGISATNGSKVFFTAAAPTANYKLKIIDWITP